MRNNENLGRLQALLPRLMRFASVLSGDADLHEFDHHAFVRHIYEVVSSQGFDETNDFSAQLFSDVYAYWLSLVEKGVLRPVILKQDESIILPGVFSDENNSMVLQTGAFLVGLPPTQRAALLLVTGEGFSYEEVAKILKISRQNVSEEIATAKGKLAGNRYAARRGVLKNQSQHQGVIMDHSTRLTGT